MVDSGAFSFYQQSKKKGHILTDQEMYDYTDDYLKFLNEYGQDLEVFVGVDANDAVISEVSADVATNVTAQLAILNATQITTVEIPQSAKGINSISKTATGNYIIEARGAGYGINGGNDYHPASGEYIIVKVSMTKDGKIIDCLTVSQEESKGIGDACADEKFYGQFVGKTESDYKNIDAISGATMTTDGYKQAIERAFAAVKILEGGAN